MNTNKTKKSIKALIAVIMSICFSFALFACSKNEPSKQQGSEKSDAVNSDENTSEKTTEEKYTPNITALKGPTGMGMAYLMDGKGENEYNISLASAPEDVVSSVVSGNTDIAAVPVNLAATLYNKLDGDLNMLAVNTLGVLYIIENGDTINDISDLAGKTVCATGQASTPEYILNYILEKNGLEDVKVKYYADHAELATLMADGQVKIGMLPEPNVTAAMAQNKDLRIALDLTAEWEKVSDAQLAQGCIIARKSFVQEHPDTVSAFLSDYKKSVDFVNNDSEAASKLIEKFGIMAKAKLAQKAIPNCNIVCITDEEMQTTANGMFEVLFSANPKSIGGKMPADDFYYIAQK